MLPIEIRSLLVVQIFPIQSFALIGELELLLLLLLLFIDLNQEKFKNPLREHVNTFGLAVVISLVVLLFHGEILTLQTGS